MKRRKRKGEQYMYRYRGKVLMNTSTLDVGHNSGDLSSAEKLFPKIERTVKSYGNLMKAYNKK